MTRDREIVFEPHARDQMMKRDVTEALVRLTVDDPDETRPAVVRRPKEPCTIYLRRIGGRLCKVYVRTGSNPPIVATVAWHGEGPRRG